MKCPACEADLRELCTGPTVVDLCHACGGAWFDHRELEQFDQSHEPAAGLTAVSPQRAVDPAPRRGCPRCAESGERVVMMRHFYSTQRVVEVDQCPACGGFWLDHGELEKVRAESTSAKSGDEGGRKTPIPEELLVEHCRAVAGSGFFTRLARTLSASWRTGG